MLPRSCSFVIPAYNEAKRISETLEAIASLSAKYLGPCEIIVVDDGSADDTAEVARAFFAPNCTVSVHSFPHRGKGFAVRQGVSAARNDLVVLCDADLRRSIDEVLYLIRALENGVDIAIGSRWLNCSHINRGQPFIRRISSRVFNLVAGHILALPFKDTQCGLKTLTRQAAHRVFPLLSLDGWGYDLELIHVALVLGLCVEEVDLHLVHDYTHSNFRPISDGWSALLELLKIRWNDIRGAYGSCALGQAFSRILLASTPNALARPALLSEQRVNPEIAEMNALPSRDQEAA